MSTPARRSRRAAQSNKKYAVDPFEQYKHLLEQSSDESGPSSDHEPDEEGSDDEFDETKAAEELAQAAANEDYDSEDEAAVSAVASSEDEAAAVPIDISDDEPVVRVTARPKTTPAKRAAPKKAQAQAKKRADHSSYNNFPIFDPLGNTGAKGRNIHYTRGIPEPVHQQSRESRLLYSIGPGEEDLVAHIQARERWLNDTTVPFRKSHKDGVGGGLAFSTFYPEEKRRKEAIDGMKWYYEEGGEQMFERSEVHRVVDQSYAPSNYSRSNDIVAGPVNAQQRFDGVDLHQSWDLGDAYARVSKSDTQRAWVINAGARIQNLEWCPNKNGTSQYLAVSTGELPSDTKTDQSQLAPAYTPQSRRQQCLQIWEIQAHGTSGSIGSQINFDRKPILRRVVSTEWGCIKKMRWCPTPDRSEQLPNRLGLLAIISEDGKLRVLDVSLSLSEDSEAEFVHIEKTAFESKPPDTICTCLTWLSSKNIAAGTADGSVAIWTLPDNLSHDTFSPPSGTRPWFYQRLHQAFIQSLTSGYPSRPHILVTHSLDGLLRATDLRSPSIDTVVSQRSRIAQGPVMWHDISQSALNVDDNFTMKSYGARVFYKATSVARLTAFAADFATSNLHASVLVGCVDGTVWATNPMRRLRDHKHKPLVQCVLKHEWRRPVSKPQDTADHDGDTEMGEDRPDKGSSVLSKPLIRFLTGFKIQQTDMGQENRANATRDYVSFATVYEEKTAVTQVAWNPNLRAGTWGAMGMGSGLVVVRDLAAD